MKNIKTLLLFLFLFAYGSKAYSQNFPDLHFGTDETLDIITWNIEWFPKEGQTTINNVKGIIKALDAEIIAIQEVDSKSSLQLLLNQLDDYDGYYLNDDYQSLAYIYKKSNVEILSRYEIYTTQPYWKPFPRSPLVLKIRYKNENYYIINNHLKCCGDGYLDPYDSYDEEARRQQACQLLDDYISEELGNQKVILLGDLNDEITDYSSDNVFNIFLNKEEEYLFTNMEIAEGNANNWSYPSWPSHLDHILITNELFDRVRPNGASCEVIKLDEHFYGGFYEYDNKVSDHRPVGIKLKTEAQGILGPNSEISKLENSPNPFSSHTLFEFPSAKINSEILIYDLEGRLMDKVSIPLNSTSYHWYPKQLKAGIYYSQFLENNLVLSAGKLIINPRF